MHRYLSVIVCLTLLSIPGSGFHQPATAAVIRVKTTGSDASDGSSWMLAKRTVQAALDAAAAGDEVWVAAGTYHEHLTNPKDGGLAVDMALYGGFAGTEDVREARDWQANPTVLHGSNTGTVMRIDGGASRQTRIDGFVITGGNHDPLDPGDPGGGIRMVGSAPTIANNTISGNLTNGIGAGISIWFFRPLPGGGGEFPLITGNMILDNLAYEFAGDGGGIGIINSSPEIRGNRIARNQASQNGGGICCWRNSLPIIAGNVIVANAANILDGGSDLNYGGGGIFACSFYEDGTPCSVCVSAPVLIGNLIAANGALKGGGIALTDSNGGSATVTNNTIVANSGAGIHWANVTAEVRNNVVAVNTWGLEQWAVGSSAVILANNDVYGNDLQGGNTDYAGIPSATGTIGNISVDPRFANPAIGDYHLQTGSSCVDAGDNDAAEPAWTDLDGQPRVIGTAVDMGADESDGTTWNVPTPVIHVSPDGDDAASGASWTAARRTLAGGILAAAATGGEVWIRTGTYGEHVEVPAWVGLYGGFAGDETARDQRDPAMHPTIIDGGGTPPVVSFTRSGYRISRLDGMIVQHGGVYVGTLDPLHLPDPASRTGGRGGGLFIRTSGPVITGSTIRWNSVGSPYTTLTPFAEGAGIGCFVAHPTITGCTITANENLSTTGQGGGIYCSLSRPWIHHNTIADNRAVYGGGVYGILSEPCIAGNRIEQNTMYDFYAMYQGAVWGAVALDLCRDFTIDANRIADNTAFMGAGICLPGAFNGRIRNNVIVNNHADQPYTVGGTGGGIYCMVQPTPHGDTLDDVLILNNTIVGNTATTLLAAGGGGGVALDILEERIVIANNVIAFNSSGIYQQPANTNQPLLITNNLFDNPAGAGTDVNYVNIIPGADDLSVPPGFVDSDGADDDPATSTDNDYHLAAGAPMIDAGDATVAGLPVTDADGDPRVVDGDGDATAAVDVGADEFRPPCPADRNADGDVDGVDLAWIAAQPFSVPIAVLAGSFGRTDCP